MNKIIELYGVESSSPTLNAEKLVKEKLNSVGGYPEKFDLKIYMEDGRLCWDYDRSVEISFEQEKVLVEIVNSVCKSLNR